MKIFKIIVISVIFCGFIVKVSAQRSFTDEAEEAFNQKKYSDAIELYKKAYSKIKSNPAEKARIKFKTAECYRYMGDSKNAESWYQRVIKAKYSNPLIYLYYADALKSNEKYEEAIIQYGNYKEKAPNDPAADIGIESCKLAQKWFDNPTRYEVNNEKKFNSPQRDFCPTYGDRNFKKLLFTSTRENTSGRGYDEWLGESFSDIYEITMDRRGAWSAPVPIDAIINSESNEGAACLNDKGNVIYFTRCLNVKKEQQVCHIFEASKKGNEWDVPVQISLGPDSVSVGHPSISDDELTLYFTAKEMYGGYGGNDIWMAKRPKKAKSFEKPVNLGQTINTNGDESYPYLRNDQTLYFSSGGHIGMGGLDIFKSEKTGETWGTPVNMKSPINSAGDDFGIVFEGSKEKGYLSSNRLGGRGSDDIWSFYLPPLIFTLQGTVRDDSTKAIIVGAKVTMHGSDGTTASDTTDETGLYSFDKTQILPNTTYSLYFEKQNYFTNKGEVTTIGYERSMDLIHDKNLKPIPVKPIVLPEIRYPLDQWVLLPQYQDSLNGLIETLNDNPKITIELSSHTDFRASDTYNDTLSQRRAQSVVDYLISKGIEPGRLTARGYGEKSPRVLYDDMIIDGIKFKKGTQLTESYILSLPTTLQKEAAHQLNRRTEFRVLRTDYVPSKNVDEQKNPVKIEIINNGENNNTNNTEQNNITPDDNK